MVRQRFMLELTVWNNSPKYSLIQNADSVTTTTLWKQTGSLVRRSHQLSMSWNTDRQGTINASFAKTLLKTLGPRLFLSVFHLLDTSKIYTPRFHIDTTSKLLLRLSTHVMDQRMVTPLFRSGVRTSQILVTISDATSVPGVLRLSITMMASFGATQLYQMSSEKLSHFRFP